MAEVCSTCGQPTQPGARFCSSCGAPLAVAADQTTSLPVVGQGVGDTTGGIVSLPALSPDVPAGAIALVVVRGPLAGERFVHAEPVVTLGRSPQSTVFLDDVTVSRRHAELRRDVTGSWQLVDAGSLNGTYLNRQRVDEAVLTAGDEVQVGKYRFLVQLAAEPS